MTFDHTIGCLALLGEPAAAIARGRLTRLTFPTQLSVKVALNCSRACRAPGSQDEFEHHLVQIGPMIPAVARGDLNDRLL
jgi:hypothetical protein